MGSIRIKTENTGSSTDWKTIKRIHLSIANNIWTPIKSIWIFATNGWQLVRRWKNPENTVLPSFTGIAAIADVTGLSIGSLLEGNDGSWTSEDGPITYAYQWLISDSSGGQYTEIDGATNINFTPSVSTTYDDKFIRFQVEATNDSGSTIALSSAQRIIRNKPVGSTTNIVISGSAQTESTLSLSSPTNIVDAWNVTRLVTNDRRPTSYVYNWLYSDDQYAANNVLNSPTLTTYTITSDDVGKKIKLRVTATNSGGSTNKDSNLTNIIVATPGPWNITSATQAKPTTRNGNRNLTINYGSSTNAASYEFKIDGYDPEVLGSWVDLGGGYTYTTTNSSSSSFSVPSVNASTGNTYIYYRVTGRSRNVDALRYSNGGTLSSPVFVQSTGTAPSAPTINSISPSSTSAVVNFTAPVDTGSNFLAGTNTNPLYYYSLNSGVDQPVTANNQTQLTISGLSPNTSYSVRIRAINDDALFSAYSNSVNFITTVAPPTNTVLPSISGTIKEGQQVTANVGTWTGNPTSYSIIWYGLKYSQQLGDYLYTNLGTGNSFTIPLNFNDLYDYLQIEVTATNAGGSGIAYSPMYAVTTTTIPTITLNTPVTTTNSVTISWSSTNQATYSITGITGGPYTGTTQTSRTISPLSAGTYNYTVTVTSSTNDSASASGSFTIVSVPVNSVAPVVSPSAAVGGTQFSSTTGTWSPTPTNYQYQWQRTSSDGGAPFANISGATSSTLNTTTGEEYLGEQIRCLVRASSDNGTTYSNFVSSNVADVLRPGLVPTFGGNTSVTGGFNGSVTNYNASYSWSIGTSAGSVAWGTISGSTRTFSVTGLSSGQSATVTVTTSRAGYDSSSASTTGSASIPAVIPTVTLSSPTNITNTSATVNWTSTNQVSWSISGFPSSYSGSSQTSANITGLVAGTTYNYTVTVTSSTGNMASASGSLTTTGGVSPPATPSTPSLFTVATRTWQADWVAVSGATSYTLYIQYSTNGSTVGSSTSISGITGTTRTYSNASWRFSRAAVQAVNSAGSSGISSYSPWRDGDQA